MANYTINELPTKTIASTDLIEVQATGGGSSGKVTVKDITQRVAVSVKDYGAIGDGSTDDTAAFQSAINSGYPVYVPYTVSGYRVSTLDLSIATNIFGDTRKTVLRHFGSTSLFNIKTSNITIQSFFVDATTATGGEIFDFRTDVASLDRIILRDIEALSANGLMVDRNSTGTLAVLYCYNVISRYNKGRGVYLRDTTGYIRFEDVSIDYVGSSTKNAVGIQLNGNRGSQFTRCDVTGGYDSATTDSNVGFLFDDCQAVWLTGCISDSCGADGFIFQNSCANIYLSQTVSSFCCGHQFVVNGSDRMHFVQCTANGRNGLTNKAATKHGFYTTNSAGFTQISECCAMFNTGDGYRQDGATGLILSGSRTYQNTGRGLRTVGASSYSMSSGCQFVGDVVGNYDLATNKDHVAASQINSGALSASTGPATA